MTKNNSFRPPSQDQHSVIIESFESARIAALQKLASRDNSDFQIGQLNWWSGKIGSIITHASQIQENFRRGRYALNSFNDADSVQAIGNSIKKNARNDLEEIIKTAIAMYYQFCIDLDDVKEKGKR